MPKARPSKRCDDKKQRVEKIVRTLEATYPLAVCALRHESPFELLVATILSAQCTDERVNMVTPSLFAKYPNAQEMAQADQKDLEQLIRSTGFYRNKSTNLIGMAKAVVEKHHGQVPKTLDELVQLPGVGRKTANVLLGTAFGIPSGVVVDTHVKRISHLLGLTSSENAEQIERDLMELLAPDEWINFSHRLIHHGRRVCVARRPKCLECSLLCLCPRIGLEKLSN